MLMNEKGAAPTEETTPHKDHLVNTKITLVNQAVYVVSGHGSYHTANPAAKNPRPYQWISFQDVTSMVKNPVDVPKPEAPWAIFSSTGGPQAREHKFQREHGCYHALVADLDEVGSLTSLDISTALKIVFPKSTTHIVYSTKSATPENNKSRIIVPLSVPVSGADYEIYQKIFNDKLVAAGIEPDRATERCGQLFYLPNRGAFYDYHIA